MRSGMSIIKRSAPFLSFPRVSFETVPMLVRLTTNYVCELYSLSLSPSFPPSFSLLLSLPLSLSPLTSDGGGEGTVHMCECTRYPRVYNLQCPASYGPKLIQHRQPNLKWEVSGQCTRASSEPCRKVSC